MFYTYILRSQVDSSFYIGYSQDPWQRLAKHNTARTGYTATKQQWVVVYQEAFAFKSEALNREKFVKAQKNRDFYDRLITTAQGSSVG